MNALNGAYQILKSWRRYPRKTTKADQEFAKILDFSGIIFPNIFAKLKKRIPSPLVFLVMKIRKKNLSCVPKKCCEERHIDLLSIGEKGKRHYVLTLF